MFNTATKLIKFHYWKKFKYRWTKFVSKCKYSVTKHDRDGFDAVGDFPVSELLETDKIYL
jgi:hypothetical protein